MKKIMLFILVLALAAGPVFGAGGKNQGTSGKGETTTGSDASGSASQQRSGR